MMYSGDVVMYRQNTEKLISCCKDATKPYRDRFPTINDELNWPLRGDHNAGEKKVRNT